jgi:ABC-type transporter Mla MlaB component
MSVADLLVKVTIDRDRGFAILALSGTLEGNTAAVLLDAADRVCVIAAAGDTMLMEQRAVIDLFELDSCDVAGAQTLCRAREQLERLQLDVTLEHVPPQLAPLLTVLAQCSTASPGPAALMA